MLFGKSKDKVIESVVNQIKVDLSNNYKDNAVLNIKKLGTLLDEREKLGKMKSSDIERYRGILRGFEDDVKNFKRTY